MLVLASRVSPSVCATIRSPAQPLDPAGFSWTRCLILLLPLPSLLVFGWVLESRFLFDDFIHLYDLANYGYLRLALTPHGGHLLLTSNSAYLVLSRLFGLVPRWWFAVVLATHAVNVLLLFRLVQALTGRALLAGGLAMLWGMAPTNQASLSWFAVYGHVLVATFVLWLLGDMARIEAAGRNPSAATQARWALLALGAATSFGIGLGISLALAAATPLLLPHVANRRTVAVVLAASAVVLVALYLGVRPIQAWLWAGHAIPFDPASDIVSGLLSGPWRFIGLTGACFTDLVSYGVSSLVLGPLIAFTDKSNSTAIGPWQGVDPTWFSRGVAAGVLVLSAASLRRATAETKRVQAGLYLLIAACYAPVAVVLGGRTVSIAPLLALGNFVLPPSWLAMAARYQYAGQALLAASLGIALGSAADRSPRLAHPLQWSLIGWLVLASPLYWEARSALTTRWDPLDAEKAMNDVRAVVERSPVGEDAYVENRPWMLKDINFPGLAALFLVFNPDDVIEGRRVHFIERDPALFGAIEVERGRMAGLLVRGR